MVAAVGNSDDAPGEPWPFASYPAALPHVIGVGALTKTGAVPAFSNRDAVYNDLVAPGAGIFSTLPRQMAGMCWVMAWVALMAIHALTAVTA